ncbi:hypothetical protein [Nitrosomonas europaea]|uniref:hypothetical protein n=1 Tax=Nitrosomonas europaea TaxID=915 RepID=UPI00059CE082|nr:hypothetical protein [Nitrosomonas europaea]SDW50745.1 hypothetical protein SAMN05216310_11913 [Nitrosomonas europaea]SET12794.1 hypothetical protein SAMN05216309_12013 [Nitrosomonas europaea]SJZ69843.1 hypothetical protein SAMN02745113_01648 [Nitrosomonas europaea]HBF26030.1 hypothetical protein [Nitrosomonas sp.]
MCNCKPTGRQTADKIWGNGRASQATDSWPPIAKKPKPFTDSEMTALTRIVKDSIAELRRKRKPKPALSAAQVAAIRRIVQDARKPVREMVTPPKAGQGCYIGDSRPEHRAERITKIRTDNPRLHGEIVHIGGMKCQLVDGRMICR